MARSKNKTNNKGTDGKRKETKEERRARLESTAEAREVRSHSLVMRIDSGVE